MCHLVIGLSRRHLDDDAMNKLLQAFARKSLKNSLGICTEKERMIFKRMYAIPGHAQTDSIDEVVDKMHFGRLNYAMDQVQRTIEKKGAK